MLHHLVGPAEPGGRFAVPLEGLARSRRFPCVEQDVEDPLDLIQLTAGLVPVGDGQLLLQQLALQRLRQQADDEVDLRGGEGEGFVGGYCYTPS